MIAGGSGGSRVSLLTAARHREVASGLALWWISGGVYGLMVLGVHYCGGSLAAAWNGGMEAVVTLPEWAEALERNPASRDLFLAQDNHTRATSEELARLLPAARLAEPPWGDDEWNRRSAARPGGRGEGLFTGWPRLAPALQAWADETLG